VAGFPGFEFASHVFPPCHPQFSDDAGMLRGQPILKFVERFDGRENGGGDFNGFRFHGVSLSRFARKGKGFPLHGFLLKLSRWCVARAEAAAWGEFPERHPHPR
jgi:hypothetical protein